MLSELHNQVIPKEANKQQQEVLNLLKEQDEITEHMKQNMTPAEYAEAEREANEAVLDFYFPGRKKNGVR
jgi:hypothetical protein